MCIKISTVKHRLPMHWLLDDERQLLAEMFKRSWLELLTKRHFHEEFTALFLRILLAFLAEEICTNNTTIILQSHVILLLAAYSLLLIVKHIRHRVRRLRDLDWKCSLTELFSKLPHAQVTNLSLIHIWRCRRIERCRSRWSPYH